MSGWGEATERVLGLFRRHRSVDELLDLLSKAREVDAGELAISRLKSQIALELRPSTLSEPQLRNVRVTWAILTVAALARVVLAGDTWKEGASDALTIAFWTLAGFLAVSVVGYFYFAKLESSESKRRSEELEAEAAESLRRDRAYLDALRADDAVRETARENADARRWLRHLHQGTPRPGVDSPEFVQFVADADAHMELSEAESRRLEREVIAEIEADAHPEASAGHVVHEVEIKRDDRNHGRRLEAE